VLQAAANLVVEAVEASPGARVQVRVRRREPSGLVLELHDPHRELDPGEATRLFDPYAAAATPTAEGLPSRGIRLPLTRALVQAMGGSLQIDALAGGGALFTLEVPLEEVERRAPAPPPSARPLRILVVEDNELNALVLGTMLRQLGHAVETAADGAEALTKVTERRFDLILMDKHMPIMDGVEAMRRIRALPSGAAATPIYIVSADARCDVGEGRFDGYIGKPLDRSAVERAIVDAAARGL